MKKILLSFAAMLAAAGITSTAQIADFEVVVPSEVTGVLSSFKVTPKGSVYYAIEPGDNYASITIEGEDVSAVPVENGFSNGEVKFTPPLTESGKYTITFPQGAFMLEQAYGKAESQEKTITFDVEINNISDVTFTVTPSNNSEVEIDEDGTVSFDITFSAPVCLTEYKYGKTRDGDLTVIPAPGENVYEEKYTCTFPASYINHIIWGWDPFGEIDGFIFATLYAVDQNGAKVQRKDYFGESFDDLSVSYKLDTDRNPGAPFDVTLPSKAEKELNSFRVSAPEGFTSLGNGGQYWDSNTNSYEGGLTAITITGDDFTAHATGFSNGVVTFSPAITKSGEYNIEFPYHVFTLVIETKDMPDQGRQEGDIHYHSAQTDYAFNIEIVENLFKVPEPEIIVPLGGEAETLNNMVEVTWGYYGLTDNSGDNGMNATLTFPDGTSKTVKGQIADANGIETGQVTSMPADEDNALMFRNFLATDENSNMLIFDAGTYTLTIPEGIVLVNGEPNPAAELKFVITGSGAKPSLLMDAATIVEPASEFVGACSTLSLTWDMQTITLTDKAKEIMVKIGDETYNFEQLDYVTVVNYVEGGGEPGIMALEEGDAEGDAAEGGNLLVIALDPFEVWGKTGEYVFMIPEGTVENEKGQVNPAQNVTIYVLPISEATLTITPECGNYGTATVKDLDEITLSWGVPAALNDGATIRIDSEDGTLSEDLAESDLISISDTDIVTIDTSSLITENGKYNFVLGEGAFLLGEMNDLSLNQEGYYSYVVTDASGISKFVDAEEGRYTVYGLDGVMILSTDNAAELLNLQPGRIYIVNGQKVLVRK